MNDARNEIESGADTLFTEAARLAYLERAEELLATLREHVTLTSTRDGQRAEQANYVTSASALAAAVEAFADAEVDWCGVTALAPARSELSAGSTSAR